jgi:hypothetical protein
MFLLIFIKKRILITVGISEEVGCGGDSEDGLRQM